MTLSSLSSRQLPTSYNTWVIKVWIKISARFIWACAKGRKRERNAEPCISYSFFQTTSHISHYSSLKRTPTIEMHETRDKEFPSSTMLFPHPHTESLTALGSHFINTSVIMWRKHHLAEFMEDCEKICWGCSLSEKQVGIRYQESGL